MKYLLVLACIGATLCLTNAVNTKCPPRRFSPLKPKPTFNCNICDLLEEEDSDFYQKCGKHLDPVMVWKIVKDCNRLWDMDDSQNKKSHLKYFWENLNLLCEAKKVMRFDPPRCECDPCDELAMLNSDFMIHCAPQLAEYEVHAIIGKCHAMKHDYATLWKFFQIIKGICKDASGVTIKFTMCECDVCWLLTEESSSFMQECGSNLDPILLDKIEESCEKIMCDPEDLGYFKWNLELFCDQKFNASFEFPQCACDECWLLFHWDSDFMQNCGQVFTETMLMKLKTACYNNLDSMNNLLDFMDNLEMICHQKGQPYFRKELCECDDCWLLFDPTEQIWQECISKLTDAQRQDIKSQCMAAGSDDALLAAVKSYTLDICANVTDVAVQYPTCEDCELQDVCIVFVVDASGSINGAEFADELNFVEAIVTAFGSNIGPSLSRVGLIQYGSNVQVELNLCNDTSEAIALSAIQTTLAGKLGGLTNTGGAINAMASDFVNCCDNGRQMFGVVLTDGQSNNGPPIATALGNLPAGVTMISIGVGTGTLQAELLEIAQGDANNVLEVNEASDLTLIVDKLKDAIGCQ